MTAKQPPQIRIVGDQLSVDFGRFDRAAYELFLRVKRLPEYRVEFSGVETFTWTVTAPARFAPLLGVPLPEPERPPLPLADYLFDDQREIVCMAMAAKRFACWMDTGLGKTAVFLEWARQVSHAAGGGRVLIVTLANLVEQTLEMARQFYPGDALPIVRIKSKAHLRAWCAGKALDDEVATSGPAVAGSEVDGDRSPAVAGAPLAAGPAGERGGDGGAPCAIDIDRPLAPSTPLIAIVNYEKFNPDDVGKAGAVNECRHLAGVVLDESSRLAMGGGKQKWCIIHSTKGVTYKLSCTATPAPNDTMEFASQASFLERMRAEGEIIWTYFTRHPKTHRWTVKKHARAAFFEFMSSWSIYVRDPRRYGWRAGMADVPPPVILKHEVPATAEQIAAAAKLTADADSGQTHLFVDRDTNTVERGKLSQVAKGFVYVNEGDAGTGKKKDPAKRRTVLIPSHKPAKVAELVKADVEAGLHVLVWTVFDAETDLIARALAEAGVKRCGVEVLTGKVAKEKRGPMLERFRVGTSRVLVARASMLGFGMNFQHCGSMVFSGWSDSYVAWYQAIRRAYRYGQTRRVRVHVPVIPALEGQMLDNIDNKADRHERDIREMEDQYIRQRDAARAVEPRATAAGRAA